MTRPLYENDRSRESEQLFLFLFPRYVKLPKRYGFDFIYTKDGLTAIAELKERFKSSTEFKDNKIGLSWAKVEEMKRWPCAEGRIFFLLTDGLFSIRMQDYEATPSGKPILHIGGRKDRGDWQDIEPMVSYDVKHMTKHFTKEELDDARKRQASVPGVRV